MKVTYLSIVFSLINAMVFAQAGYEIIGDGTLYINEKDSIKTTLGFTFDRPEEVVDIDSNKKYKPKDVRSFRIADRQYVSGQSTLGIGAFHQVVTPEFNKMQIVKTYSISKEDVKAGNKDKGIWTISVYIVSKGTNYENTKKVAEAIKTDCPELSNKILKKEAGYSVNFLSSDEDKMIVYTNIIKEMEAGCK